ncbi:hypothetical protein C942_00288 [Photobacterium marinum]|uniref:Type 4 fimbrial biogenesis protein PilX N-terminal domain-containing protein n=1 Tax=Photobacterium marinum TaxID=1056511 RepID=L8JFA3_9GAMM|nr:hypothetical protein [Photobacterium marinum]ELR66102.1 hypothetical protein C942_00288 [Photobacterium marinum]
MRRQRGVVTLLVTTMILLASLIFSLASYKNLYYQLKRSQNEVLSRKVHWLAEGGLECGFAAVNRAGGVNTALTPLIYSCETENTDININASGADYEISSLASIDNKAKAFVNKSFSLTSQSSGAFKSTSDIIFNVSGGNMDVYPDPGVRKGDEYNCILARFSGDLTIKGVLQNKGLYFEYPPYSDFDFSGKPKCKSNYRTVSVKNTSFSLTPERFNSDFKKEVNLDPFKEMFGYSKGQWKEVKKEFFPINQGSSCSTAIAKAIKNGKQRIWIEGSCDLKHNADEINEAMTLTGAAKSALILVQDGVVAFNGAAVSLNIIIYQFLTPKTSPELPWQPSAAEWNATSVAAHVPDKSTYVHYQFGALHTKGGFVFDMPGYKANLTGSVNFSFNGDVLKDVLIPFAKPRWNQGSWRDF